jgi:hypothetical protein
MRSSLVLNVLLVPVLLLGCEKEDDADTGGEGGSGSASAADSGSAEGGGTSCGEGGSGGEDPCPAYTACIESSCGDAIQGCYVDGPCSELIDCQANCCGDAACVQGCGTAEGECATCQMDVINCATMNCLEELMACG